MDKLFGEVGRTIKEGVTDAAGITDICDHISKNPNDINYLIHFVLAAGVSKKDFEDYNTQKETADGAATKKKSPSELFIEEIDPKVITNVHKEIEGGLSQRFKSCLESVIRHVKTIVQISTSQSDYAHQEILRKYSSTLNVSPGSKAYAGGGVKEEAAQMGKKRLGVSEYSIPGYILNGLYNLFSVVNDNKNINYIESYSQDLLTFIKDPFGATKEISGKEFEEKKKLISCMLNLVIPHSGSITNDLIPSKDLKKFSNLCDLLSFGKTREDIATTIFQGIDVKGGVLSNLREGEVTPEILKKYEIEISNVKRLITDLLDQQSTFSKMGFGAPVVQGPAQNPSFYEQSDAQQKTARTTPGAVNGNSSTTLPKHSPGLPGETGMHLMPGMGLPGMGTHPMMGMHPMVSGTHPGMMSGMMPVMHPGMMSGMMPVMHPGMMSGMMPVMHAGMMQPGMHAGMMQPGMMSGMQPGMMQTGMMSGMGSPSVPFYGGAKKTVKNNKKKGVKKQTLKQKRSHHKKSTTKPKEIENTETTA